MAHQRTSPIYSAAAEYAVRALVHLAKYSAGACIRSSEIAREENIPEFFLPAILQTLVRKGILSSSKGRTGGFALSMPARRIRLLDIVYAVDGTACDEECALGFSRCSLTNPCAMHDSWKEVRRSIREYLQRITIADLAASTRQARDRNQCALNQFPQPEMPKRSRFE